MVLDIADIIIRVVTVLTGIGAIYFVYRLTKITGLFLGWALLISAVIVRLLDNIVELMLDVDLLAGTAIMFTEDVIFPLLVTVLLLLAMYTLFRTFQRVAKKSSSQTSSLSTSHS